MRWSPSVETYFCLTQVKQALKIEENICRKNNNEDKFGQLV